MRIVRFHLEPWQKGGSELSIRSSDSPSLVISPSVSRRQRPPSVDDILSIDVTLFEKRQKLSPKWRYPQMVKRLSTLCCDVLVKYVNKNKYCYLFTVQILDIQMDLAFLTIRYFHIIYNNFPFFPIAASNIHAGTRRGKSAPSTGSGQQRRR